jgi:hypothetical protein
MKPCTHYNPDLLHKETDKIKTCPKCGKVIPAPLSQAGVKTALAEMLPRAAADSITDLDVAIWQTYGHMIISGLRDKYERWPAIL